MEDVLVGILGGMGPAATADFYRKLIAATPAGSDQDHLRVVIWADPTVPDRSSALLDGGPDPRPQLAAGVRFLRDAGAGIVAVPCNTAHAFLTGPPGVSGTGDGDLRFVDMIEEVARHLAGLRPRVGRIALLATSGTVRSGLYTARLARYGLAAELPTDAEQAEVMAVIRAVKAGRADDELQARMAAVAAALVGRGADAVVAGCTEVPLVLGAAALPVPLVDGARTLAEAVVLATGRVPVRAGRAP
jgi:aspartate racemase